MQQAGLIVIEKSFRGGKVPRTSIQITAKGRDSITQHWQRLAALRKAAEKWSAPPEATRQESEQS
jgi:DNA-binding PadR family transcriptional regulator